LVQTDVLVGFNVCESDFLEWHFEVSDKRRCLGFPILHHAVTDAVATLSNVGVDRFFY
jgi:hypothetical protein